MSSTKASGSQESAIWWASNRPSVNAMLVVSSPQSSCCVSLKAYATREPIRPIIESFPHFDLTDAYEIQRAQAKSWTDAGRVIKGHKVGLTSRAMQLQLGVDQPNYGVLRDDMFYLDSELIAVDAFISPKVEPEISFVLKGACPAPA